MFNFKKNLKAKYKKCNSTKQVLIFESINSYYDIPQEKNMYNILMKIQKENLKKNENIDQVVHDFINDYELEANSYIIEENGIKITVSNINDYYKVNNILNDYFWYGKTNYKLYLTQLQYRYYWWRKNITQIQEEIKSEYSGELENISNLLDEALDENKAKENEISNFREQLIDLENIKTENMRLANIEDKYKELSLSYEELNDTAKEYGTIKDQYDELLEKYYKIKNDNELTEIKLEEYKNELNTLKDKSEVNKITVKSFEKIKEEILNKIKNIGNKVTIGQINKLVEVFEEEKIYYILIRMIISSNKFKEIFVYTFNKINTHIFVQVLLFYIK